MSNTTHTPGPWAAEYSSYGEEIWFGGEGCGMWTIDPPSVYMSGEEGGATAAANARLIAAAPDLLAACKALLRQCECSGAPDSPDMAKARATIAKATGEDTEA